jgi:hypothetical protein
MCPDPRDELPEVPGTADVVLGYWSCHSFFVHDLTNGQFFGSSSRSDSVGTILSTMEGLSSVMVFEVSEGGDEDYVEETELAEPDHISVAIF